MHLCAFSLDTSSYPLTALPDMPTFQSFFLCTIQFGYAGEVVDQFCGHAKSRASGPSTMNHYASFANQSLGVGALTTLALWNLIVSFCFENPLCSNGV